MMNFQYPFLLGAILYAFYLGFKPDPNEKNSLNGIQKEEEMKRDGANQLIILMGFLLIPFIFYLIKLIAPIYVHLSIVSLKTPQFFSLRVLITLVQFSLFIFSLTSPLFFSIQFIFKELKREIPITKKFYNSFACIIFTSLFYFSLTSISNLPDLVKLYGSILEKLNHII